MTALKRFLGVMTAIMAVTYFSMSGSQEQSTLFVFLGVVMIIATIFLFKPTKKDKEKQAEKRAKLHEKLQSCTMKHINGLPIAENVNCNITSTADKFTFSSGTMNFELDKSKITDMCLKTDREFQQQYVSSVGGAVGGAVLFGPLGAIIGGRAKKKTIKDETHHYFIITYQSDDSIKYIGFDTTYALASADAYIQDFKNKCTPETTYQL